MQLDCASPNRHGVALIDAAEREPNKRGPYKPRQPKSGAKISK
jgi:hypothetical protein